MIERISKKTDECGIGTKQFKPWSLMMADCIKIALRVRRVVLGIPEVKSIEKCMVDVEKIHHFLVEEPVLLLVKTKDYLIYSEQENN